jgi:hypothetical protein
MNAYEHIFHVLDTAVENDEIGKVRRVQRQFERAHSFLQVVQESLRLMLMLKANNGVIPELRR